MVGNLDFMQFPVVVFMREIFNVRVRGGSVGQPMLPPGNLKPEPNLRGFNLCRHPNSVKNPWQKTSNKNTIFQLKKRINKRRHGAAFSKNDQGPKQKEHNHYGK